MKADVAAEVSDCIAQSLPSTETTKQTSTIATAPLDALRTLLAADDGEGRGESRIDHVDFPAAVVADSSSGGDDATSAAEAATFRPVVRDSVTYIVAVVLINERDEVLMMQEAKESCRGQWYLPAGRMESGESIVEAAERELAEETGLTACQLTTLLLVESAGGSWFRFVLTGSVADDGKQHRLKTEADDESLSAKWSTDPAALALRSADILPLIERAREYHTHLRQRAVGVQTTLPGWHSPLVITVSSYLVRTATDDRSLFHVPKQLPTSVAHDRLLLRLVVLIRRQVDNALHVMVSQKGATHIPVAEIHPARSVHATLKRILADMFGADVPLHRPHGLLSVEHQPSNVDESAITTSKAPTDGLCLTMLISIRVPMDAVCLIDGKFAWLPITDDDAALAASVLTRLPRNMTVPLSVVK